MMKTLMAMLMATGCAQSLVTPVPNCEVACTEDTDCFNGQTCTEGLCTSAGVVCDPEPGANPETVTECDPGAFLGCNGTVAEHCADNGTSLTSDHCNSGCNADAERCNECVPAAAACSGTAVQTCGADGLIAATESCTIGCVADTTARCAHIVPAFLPTVCDVLATEPALVFASGQQHVLDTDNAASCNGGIVTQQGGPEVCVVRYGTISFDGPLEVIGGRAIAFVADGKLEVDNIIDVSARARASGPGGGNRLASAAPGKAGGGGAGGKQTGASGGGADEFNQGGTGGGIVDPQLTQIFEGGERAASAPQVNGNYRPEGGGGGGALMLISCRDMLRVAGTIEAGGGGGGAGGDGFATPVVTSLFGGGGGGAGGYVVLQGANVTVSGQLFANGGGGGGGCSGSNCKGGNGEDGAHVRARGGGVLGTGGAGGAGGFISTTPANASAGTSPGGGGGSVGRFQVYTATGVPPVLAPLVAQPSLEPSLTVSTR